MAIKFDPKCIILAILLFLLWTCTIHATSRTLEEPLSLLQRHEKWMAHHARSYKNDVEKAQRFEIFKQNLEFIESFNSEGTRSYKLGLNRFADLTHEEFQTSLLNVDSLLYHLNLFPIGNSNGNGSSNDVPDSLDWREKGAVTQVKNQGNCLACWAFAVVAAVEGINEIKTGKLVSLSEQHLLDCDPNHFGCNGGVITDAFQSIEDMGGLSSESDYPYKASEGTCNTQNSQATAATITGFEQVEKTESALLQAVSGQPVAAGITVGGKEFQLYSSGVFDGDCGSGSYHAVAVVGYGARNDGQKYWVIKNSWGTGWGEKGYMKMARDTDEEGGLCGIANDAAYPTA
ncbi:ervatamin-B-like [Ipomoea triloba]|uniref:ervatamin-B-like n=1 Tax=Ipomoea triloba TaxID=35885 RepID=UPI00125DA730|nr:ervatamin-B-like [Ipomoea triloba]